ncbi:hypothetical protein CK623_00755 [Vandammella animalimorsus]|uniref:Uncharacterized protein n=1 Tax=Vandammella animalimorsus TaxID=2029117 RepID=A0A2A2AV11_9BURK|nr:hypothetical protein [Vandammella animalimorsus]PAT41499.1 hypothetical protein CK623_00755 [Vandammella animalimorsus]
MTKDEALMELCKSLLQDAEVTEQEGWQKIILIGEVGDGHAGMHGYSYNAENQCLLVAPDPPRLGMLKQLHAVMQAENPNGRGWLKCMIRISRAGEVGADFEYDDLNRWSHTPDNYKQRMAEYAAMPV